MIIAYDGELAGRFPVSRSSLRVRDRGRRISLRGTGRQVVVDDAAAAATAASGNELLVAQSNYDLVPRCPVPHEGRGIGVSGVRLVSAWTLL
ncbi:hypothetical protein C3470_08880 [Mycobacterium kansasii]|nr:hypothetical protein C3470_08880 [Mycobacterium kansasii]